MCLTEAPVAFDHRTAYVPPIHHDRNTWPAGHYDHGFHIDPGSRITGSDKEEPQSRDQIPARIHDTPLCCHRPAEHFVEAVTGRSSNHCRGLPDCPVKPGNDTEGST
jgi:hypothetical protein